MGCRSTVAFYLSRSVKVIVTNRLAGSSIIKTLFILNDYYQLGVHRCIECIDDTLDILVYRKYRKHCDTQASIESILDT